jgi:hypothetical protein
MGQIVFFKITFPIDEFSESKLTERIRRIHETKSIVYSLTSSRPNCGSNFQIRPLAQNDIQRLGKQKTFFGRITDVRPQQSASSFFIQRIEIKRKVKNGNLADIKSNVVKFYVFGLFVVRPAFGKQKPIRFTRAATGKNGVFKINGVVFDMGNFIFKPNIQRLVDQNGIFYFNVVFGNYFYFFSENHAIFIKNNYVSA